MNNLCYTPLEIFILISCSIFSIIVLIVLLALLFNWSIDPIRTKIRYRFYKKCVSYPYLLYKKLRPRKPLAMWEWMRVLTDVLLFNNCTITYSLIIKYLETVINVSKRLILQDKCVLNLQSSASILDKDIYERVYKEILNTLNSELCNPPFYNQIQNNADDFISFLDKNRPATIPPLEECPQSKIGYYAYIKDIKSHLGLNTF